MQEQVIYNAGVIAGKPGYLSDLALQVFLLSKHNPISNPDQTAMNILLSSRVWSKTTRFSSHHDAWALQAGTTMDPAKKSNTNLNCWTEICLSMQTGEWLIPAIQNFSSYINMIGYLS